MLQQQTARSLAAWVQQIRYTEYLRRGVKTSNIFLFLRPAFELSTAFYYYKFISTVNQEKFGVL